jgi:hypothetical protein
VIVQTSFSTLSNKANHFACVPIDAKGQSSFLCSQIVS